jgi:scyllo-inositol 2-dehydrogenase (NADP+)
MAKYKTAGDIHVGVVGYGAAFNIGRTHLTDMKNAGMTPVAMADADPARQAAAREDFPGIAAFSTLGEMLRKTDAHLVAIVTPHNTHAKLALEALRAGRSVVSEKPQSITTADCDRMIAAAKQRGLVLSTYHNRHWDGNIMEAVRQIRAGAIGDVVRVEAHFGSHGQPQDWWRTSRSISGGILYDWGVHLLEYSLQIIQSDIVEVAGFAKKGYWAPMTRWKDDTVEDEGFAVVRFAGGQWLTLTITSLDSNPKRGMIEVTGTKGTYIFGYHDWETIQPRPDGRTVITKGKNPPSEGWRFYQNVADHLVKGEKLVITPEWARRPIHILDLACRSAQKGVTLKAKYK